MGYQVLITLDLPNASDDQRDQFYAVLENEDWQKITDLTTAWEISFQDGGARSGVIGTIENDLKKALISSKLEKVEYALQMAEMNISKGSFII
jgi:hypothetical protein